MVLPSGMSLVEEEPAIVVVQVGDEVAGVVVDAEAEGGRGQRLRRRFCVCLNQ